MIGIFNFSEISLGLIIFLIGLFKKIMIADTLSSKFVKPFYDFISSGNIPSIPTAWIGSISYSMQIYLDFSAYSQMASGLIQMYFLPVVETKLSWTEECYQAV